MRTMSAFIEIDDHRSADAFFIGSVVDIRLRIEGQPEVDPLQIWMLAPTLSRDWRWVSRMRRPPVYHVELRT